MHRRPGLEALRRRRRHTPDRAGDHLRRQPPVTSAIIGPRTIEQLDSQLLAAGVERR
jgi:aryl-alcohol dehydrogenase-like predicted oxidoreductase